MKGLIKQMGQSLTAKGLMAFRLSASDCLQNKDPMRRPHHHYIELFVDLSIILICVPIYIK
jgi:hypothetical protein